MNKWFIGLIGIALIILIGIVITPGGSEKTDNGGLTPASSFTHAHGLAVDPVDPTSLYIATHQGLYLLKNESELFRVGDKQDDYMGFSLHPTRANVFFTSGHGRVGGNLGFQRSEDGGLSWQKISNGLSGPVDFHAMAVSSSDPDLIVGWHRGLQISEDGGQTWQMVDSGLAQVISLEFDPQIRERVYAATPTGLLVSEDLGQNWRLVRAEGVAIAVSVDPSDNQEIFLSSQSAGLLKSSDAGQAWESLPTPFVNELALYIAPDPQDPEKLYVLTGPGNLFKTEDNGASWEKVR